MNKLQLLLSVITINYCFAQSEYYTYDEIVDTLYAWQDQFGGSNQHPSDYYNNINKFGVIYNLDSIGYSSQDSLTIYAVKLSANVNGIKKLEQEFIKTLLMVNTK